MAKNSKTNGCFTQFLFVFIEIIVFCAICGGMFLLFSNNKKDVNIADGFTISAYNIILDVKENNKIDVTENITVNWESTNHHGIYEFIPEWLQYTDKNGNTIKRKSVISNLKSTSDPYTTDWVKKKARIRIGSADKYVKLGEKTYNIKYTYDMGRDPYEGFDEFIFHAFGDYWGTEIKNASIEIHMPKSIDGYNINFFIDKFRNDNVNDFVDYIVLDNVLYAKFNQSKYAKARMEKYCSNESDCNFNGNLEKSLTIDIELPEGYFVGGSWNYGWGSFIISLIIFGITVYTLFKWIKYGKDYPKPSRTVEFYPPEKMNAAEVGYIYGKQPSKKLTISLIVQLASKGYIKIDEINENKQIQITNLAPIEPKKPSELAYFERKFPKRKIEIKKLKGIDGCLTKKEATMMKYLFKNGDTKLLETNIGKFIEVKDSLISGGYIKILNDNDSIRASDIEKQEYDEKLECYKNEMLEYNKEKSKFAPLTSLESIVYNKLFESDNVIILNEHKTFYKTFDEVENVLNSKLRNTIHDKVATSKMRTSIFITILVIVLSIISYSFVEDLDPNWKVLYLISFICVILNILFTIFMKRKTVYGEKITYQIKGFRNFLITAEKPKLEALVAEDPNYFYNILPYTYALDVSKKWISKFEDIPMPRLDMGNFDYNSDESFYDLYNDIYRPEPERSSSSSSCGGGCSSCGGGCSSCGGGGSW